MPELTTEIHKWCSQNERQSPAISRVSNGWRCSCPDFVYRRRECKHIQEAMTQQCTRGRGVLSGSPDLELNGKKKCPDCHSDLVSVKFAY